jgi:hypothetical protein
VRAPVDADFTVSVDVAPTPLPDYEPPAIFDAGCYAKAADAFDLTTKAAGQTSWINAVGFVTVLIEDVRL